MAAVIRKIAGILGLVAPVDFAIGVVLRLELRQRRDAERAEGLVLDHIVKYHRRPGAGLGLGAWTVRSLALGEDAAGAEGRRIEVLRVAAGIGPRLSHARERARRRLGVAGADDPARAELSGQRPPLRAEGGKMERDRIVEIDEPQLGIEKTNLVRAAFLGPFDGLLVQEPAKDADIFLEPGQRDRRQPQGAARGETGREAAHDPPRRQRVERGQGARRHRRDPVRRDQHAGAELDLGGVHRRRRHRHEDIGVQQLRVVEPRMGKAHFLGAFDHLPVVGRGRKLNPVFQLRPSRSSRLSATMPSRMTRRHGVSARTGLVFPHQ